VAATLSSFVEWEEQESQAVAARFVQGIRTQGLAAAGAADCLDALRQRRVDVLLIARDHVLEHGWRCAACGAIRIEPDTPAACRECGKAAVQPVDAKEELARLAGQQDCPVEVVEHCDTLMALGGVGCLLRYAPERARFARTIGGRATATGARERDQEVMPAPARLAAAPSLQSGARPGAGG
jgi:hypothetical protein